MKTKGIDKINIVTLGCSKNVVDSEFLMRHLELASIELVKDAEIDDAQHVIINTCGFIKDAKEESIDTILHFAKAKQQGKIKSLYVMGCLSERYKPELEKEIYEVDKYFGVNDLRQIIETIGIDYKLELSGERHLTTPGHYAYLKISEGCDRTCSFCAIPLIRGKHKSKPIEQLIDEAHFLGKRGVKELILIAQDLTYYGIDIYKNQQLAVLLQKLSDLPYFEWIRLHYTYPVNFQKEVVRVMKERDNICNYLDIPLQHINDKVLSKMRRNQTRSYTEDLITYLRNEIPEITLRTTMLVGHPGEGENEFEELVRFVEKVKFERLGVFTYSEEENTYAAIHFKDAIPEKTKQKRLETIMELQRNISEDINYKKIGKIFKVLADRLEGDFIIGRTEFVSPEIDNEVLIKNNSNLNIIPGNFYQIKITSSDEYDLYGEVI